MKVVSNYIKPSESCTDRAPPIISTLCAISFNLLRKQYERFVLEKLVFREFWYPNFRLRFFRFAFRKERAEPVILVCRKFESVHGARRTKQKRISYGAHDGSRRFECSKHSNLPDPAWVPCQIRLCFVLRAP